MDNISREIVSPNQIFNLIKIAIGIYTFTETCARVLHSYVLLTERNHKKISFN